MDSVIGTKLLKELKNSNSYSIVQEINQRMPLSYHCHTHVLYDLRTMLGDTPITYLEIGSLNGSSASLLLKHKYKTHVICVDPLDLPQKYHPGYDSHEHVLLRNLEHACGIGVNTFDIIKSKSTNPKLAEHLKKDNVQIDILFIDGDHHLPTVLSDFYVFSHFVKPGGFIVIDDYLDQGLPEVKAGVDKIVQFIKEAELPFDIIGVPPNLQKAQPLWSHLNEFIIYKKPIK